jgi:hypothetical protein
MQEREVHSITFPFKHLCKVYINKIELEFFYTPKSFKDAFRGLPQCFCEIISLGILLGSEATPTGTWYAPLYLSGLSRTLGDAAAKHGPYAPTSGVAKNIPTNLPARIGKGVRETNVLTSPG